MGDYVGDIVLIVGNDNFCFGFEGRIVGSF